MSERRLGIGASDMAAILGASGTYRSAYEVWLAKTGRDVEDESSKPLDLFEVGNALEPALCLYGERLAKGLGSGDSPAGHQPAFVRHPDGVVQGHPDWRVGRAVVEAKVIVHGAAPPVGKLQWEMQCRTYLALLDCDFAVLPMLDVPQQMSTEAVGLLHRLRDDPAAMLVALESAKWARLSHLVYRRDLRVEAAMLERASAWWARHVEADVPPPVDGSKGARDHLLSQHPGPEKDQRVVRRADELEELARAYAEAHEAENAAKAMKAEVGQRLMEAIGDDYGVRGTGWRATWSRYPKRGTDWARLREERPDVVAVLDEYQTESPSGRLNVRVDKEKK